MIYAVYSYLDSLIYNTTAVLSVKSDASLDVRISVTRPPAAKTDTPGISTVNYVSGGGLRWFLG